MKSGEYLAILGASGAGKTTLLNYLSAKDISRNLKKRGEILVNGVDRKKIPFSKYIAYVQQEDILFQTMTVRECLMFAAKLKLPPRVNYRAKVNQIIADLKLTKAADTKIGGPLVKGVSGGERKRCSIGVELITDPNLIFLDEPTTGLDSFTATNVMEVLRDLARSGRTVISTIHQPNSDIYNMFDKLMLLGLGKLIYFNKANKSERHFEKIGYPVPALSNPADHYLQIMAIEQYDVDELPADPMDQNNSSRSMIQKEYEQKITEMHEAYKNSDLACDPDEVDPQAIPISQQTEIVTYRANCVKQYLLIAKRSLLNLFRIPLASYVKMVSTVIISLMMILIF